MVVTELSAEHASCTCGMKQDAQVLGVHLSPAWYLQGIKANAGTCFSWKA